MPTTGNYTSNFKELLQEARRYLSLQKSYAMLDTADKLTVILSTVAIAVICFVLGSIVLFFTSFALALWIGRMAGNSAIGFVCIAVALLILLAVAWFRRDRWVIQPLARMMTRIFYNNEDEEEDQGNDNEQN
jgi:cell division protein FtsW (lipid II flippase)